MADLLGVSLTDEIKELRRKIALLDGDRKAYFENSQWTMQKNKETIQKLRATNKLLRLDLAKIKAGDEKVIDNAFQEKDPARHCAMQGMSGTEAIGKLDQQVCETKKRLNALDHQCSVKEKKLASLQTEYDQMAKEADAVELTNCGESEEAQKLRILENRLDKMNLKLNEALKIRSTYENILEIQKEERRTWPKQLDALEQGIKQQDEELKELNIMYNDAQVAKETARAELGKLEQSVFEAKRERETQLMEYKKLAEEKKEYADKVEKRLQRTSLQQEDANQDQKSQLSGEEQEQKITTYEDAMSKIKDATGVSDIKEVVQRFLSQGSTQKHLELLKRTNETTLMSLKEEIENLLEEFENMKYSGETKMSSGQKMLEQFQDNLKLKETELKETKQGQENCSRLLADVKSGVDHLIDKLQHIKAPDTNSNSEPSKKGPIIGLLNICEEKLMKLIDELGGKDIHDVVKEMEDNEFRSLLETKLPAYNTRVKLPTVSERQAGFDDDDESGDDDEFLSRNAIKKHSQQIVDAKTKKNKPKQKRKTKK